MTPKQRGRVTPTTSYAERERQAIADFALRTLVDPKSSDADRNAARDRLTRDDRPRDFAKLTMFELRLYGEACDVLRHCWARARGDELPPLDPPDLDVLALYGGTPDADDLRGAYPAPKPKPKPAPNAKPERAAKPR